MGMNPSDLGDSASVEDTDWGKKAANEIDNMSKSEMAEIGSVAGLSGDDKLMQKFQDDVQQAKKRAGHATKATKPQKTKIEMEADEALADPQTAQKLKEEGEKAELDYQAMVPGAMSLLQEGPEDGADDLGESSLALMGGNDNDVAKMINQQINSQVSNQLGSIPAESGDVNVLQQFEQDKQTAEEFVLSSSSKKADTKPASPSKSDKAKKAFAEAQLAMKASAVAMKAMEKTELGEGPDTN